MSHIILWVLLASELWHHPSWGNVYPYHITRKTPKSKRWWKGPQYNTGRNFGGWLFQVQHTSASVICGASYYSPLLMIASANCIHPHRYDLEGTSVEPTFTEEDIYGLIDTVYTPNEFQQFHLYMDIAVILLQSPIKGKTTEFIKLCSKPIKPGMWTTVYAWGFDSMHMGAQTTNTKSGIVPVEDVETCRKKLRTTDTRLSSTSFCVTHPKNARKCLYDGGAPLTYGTELCGVVSYGPVCTNAGHPGVYTDINKVADFIEDIEYAIKIGLLKRRIPLKKYMEKRSGKKKEKILKHKHR
ncbi:seminase-like [Drosophila rhopaloa]|uniref:trypsin n=1 Tax=Drosophila rhopaloa TaxID=1041015 RepID=A0A6P4FEV4_DRORH|nr:seminase-like [Drosophila rhopaloa]